MRLSRFSCFGPCLPPHRKSCRNSKVLVAPMENGLDGIVSAQIIQQKVPLQIVTDQNQADYILTGQANATGETHKGSSRGVLGIINPERNQTQYSVSVKIESVSSTVVVWAYDSNNDVQHAAKDIGSLRLRCPSICLAKVLHRNK